MFTLGHFKSDLLAVEDKKKEEVLVSLSTNRISWLKTWGWALFLSALNPSSAKCSKTPDFILNYTWAIFQSSVGLTDGQESLV